MNKVFANCSEEDEIYPLTTVEIVAAQWANVSLKHPIPKISTILQELVEGFTYSTALDLNMGYYTIRLDPTVSEMCTIIFP